jgi:hypothetical protein
MQVQIVVEWLNLSPDWNPKTYIGGGNVRHDRGSEIRNRATQSLAGLQHRSDRGSQYAAERYHDSRTVDSLLGSMNWRANRCHSV